ncbi:MAG: signal recognition particle-docking protein FtsY [Candidatus Latescibacteria bacterium]|nr:signal recognition particle-docking protein FtsY [Candidatus Latescibacterota bacterium]MDP7235647.1 signal recognition particle-docking protein FtsY [Candidatus Latescibacterota bacterium]
MLGAVRRLREGLARTREGLVKKIDQAIRRYDRIDESLLEEIEEILLQTDVGVDTTMKIIDGLRARAVEERTKKPEDLHLLLRDEMARIMNGPPSAPEPEHQPHVIMVVGVNGTGKTTTIGKLAARYKQEGKKVLLAAADTFRAAAIEQLEVWARRSGVDMIRHQQGSDPSAVAFDALQAAIARDVDVLIIDTAGRLHTKDNLMEELKKIKRTLSKQITDTPHETLIVLDGTTGQNAMTQAKIFHETLDGLTGIILTKLDGTAKGGIVLSITDQLSIPVKMIGVGESIEDLQDFDAQDFVTALFE